MLKGRGTLAHFKRPSPRGPPMNRTHEPSPLTYARNIFLMRDAWVRLDMSGRARELTNSQVSLTEMFTGSSDPANQRYIC